MKKLVCADRDCRGQRCFRGNARRHPDNVGNYLILDGHVEKLPPTMDSKYFLKVQ